jgi:hypothetical protein
MMHKFVNADLLHALSLPKFSGQVAYGQMSAMTESNMKKPPTGRHRNKESARRGVANDDGEIKSENRHEIYE